MEPERRASASAAEPSGVTPERSSLCSLLPVLAEIQTLVERSNIINRTPHTDLNWFLRFSPDEPEIRLARTVQRVLACRHRPARLDLAAMAEQVREAEEFQRCVRDQVDAMKSTMAARTCEPDGWKRVGGRWDAALMDASATAHVKAAQLEQVREYHRRLNAIRALLQRLQAEEDQTNLNVVGSSALQTDRLRLLLQTMEDERAVVEELLRLSSQLSVHLSRSESSGALLAQLGDVQEEWRLLLVRVRQAFWRASNSTCQHAVILQDVEEVKAKLGARQQLRVQSRHCFHELCLRAELRLYHQRRRCLQARSDSLALFSLGQKEKDEITSALLDLTSGINAAQSGLGAPSGRTCRLLQEWIAWAKRAESHAAVGQSLALFPEEARAQVAEMRSFHADFGRRRSKLLVESERMKGTHAEDKELLQVLEATQGLYESVEQSLERSLEAMKNSLEEREKLFLRLADTDAWLAGILARRDPHAHADGSSKADIGQLESELKRHRSSRVDLEKRLKLLEAVMDGWREASPQLSPGESRYLVSRLSGLWALLDGLLAHQKASCWQLEELICRRRSSEEELSNIRASLQQTSVALAEQRFPLSQETVVTLEHLMHSLMERQWEVQELQHCQEAERSALLCAIGELQDRCKALSVSAFEQDKYLRLRKQMEESTSIAGEQVQRVRASALGVAERLRLCQTLLVELPLVKTQCQEAGDQLEAIAEDLSPSQLRAERRAVVQTVETLVSWEHSLTEDAKHLERRLLPALRFSSELPAFIRLLEKLRWELRGAEPVKPDERVIDGKLQRCWVIWRSVECGVRVLEGLGQTEKIDVKSSAELCSLEDAAKQECRLRMESLSQARESLKDYHWAAQGAIGFLHNAEATFLTAPGGFLDCREEQKQTQEALEALEDGFQAHINHLSELLPRLSHLSRPETEELHINLLGQLTVGRAVLEAQAQIRLESLQRCEVRQRGHEERHEDLGRLLAGLQTKLSERTAEKSTSSEECAAQQEAAKSLMEELRNAATRIEELRAGCPMQGCAVGKGGEPDSLWRRWLCLRRGLGLLTARAQQRAEEWSDITASVKESWRRLQELQADVPDSSSVNFATADPQELLAQAEVHQASLEEQRQALAFLEHRVERALLSSAPQEPLGPGPVGKTLLKIRESVRRLKKRNQLVLAAAQDEERHWQEWTEDRGQVERWVGASLPLSGRPLQHQERGKDLSSQEDKPKDFTEAAQSHHPEMPADISRKLEDIRQSVQTEEERKRYPVCTLDSQVAELESGLEKVKALLEEQSPTVPEAQRLLKNVWDKLDAWHGRLMLLENEVQEVAEDHPQQADVLTEQLTRPLQLYQNAAHMAEQRTAFLGKIPACLREFDGVVYSATCWIDEAQSWLSAPCCFTTAKSLQNHANSLQLVLDDSERIRRVLQDFRTVLEEISAVCDMSFQEDRLEQSDQTVHKTQRTVLEQLWDFLQAARVVETTEQELKTIESTVPELRTVFSRFNLHNQQAILANLASMRRTLEEVESRKGELHLPQGAEESLLIFPKAAQLLQRLQELEGLSEQQAAQLKELEEKPDFSSQHREDSDELLPLSGDQIPDGSDLFTEMETSVNVSASVPDKVETASVPVVPELHGSVKELLPEDQVSECPITAGISDLTFGGSHTPHLQAAGRREEGKVHLSPSGDACQDQVTDLVEGTFQQGQDSKNKSSSMEAASLTGCEGEEDEEDLSWHRLYLQICQKTVTLGQVNDERQTPFCSEDGERRVQVLPQWTMVSSKSALQQAQESVAMLRQIVASTMAEGRVDGLRPSLNEELYRAARKVLSCLSELTESAANPCDGRSDDQLRQLQQECLATELVTLSELLAAVEWEMVPGEWKEHPEAGRCVKFFRDCLAAVQLTSTPLCCQLSQELRRSCQHQELKNLLHICGVFEPEQCGIFLDLMDTPIFKLFLLGRVREHPGDEARLQRASHSLLQGISILLEQGEACLTEGPGEAHSRGRAEAALRRQQKLLRLLRSQVAFIQHLFQRKPKALVSLEAEWTQLEVRARCLQQKLQDQEVFSHQRIKEWTRWEEDYSRLNRTVDEAEAFLNDSGTRGDEEKLTEWRLEACQQTLVKLGESRAAAGLLLDQLRGLQVEPAFAATVAPLGGALELRWQSVCRQTELETQRCRDRRDSMSRSHALVSSVTNWLVGTNKLLKTWSDRISVPDVSQECVQNHLIKLLDFFMETEAVAVTIASLSAADWLSARVTELEMGWGQVTSALSGLQERLQQRLLEAWPPAALLPHLQVWFREVETRLLRVEKTLAGAENAAQLTAGLQTCRGLKAAAANAQILLEFLCQTGPQPMGEDAVALTYQNTVFAEEVGDLRLRCRLFLTHLGTQMDEAEQMRGKCAKREERLRRLRGWAEEQMHRLSQRNPPVSQTQAQQSLLELEEVAVRASEVGAAVQALDVTRGLTQRHPCDLSFSAQAQAIRHACEDLGEQLDVLRAALQQAVELWSRFGRDQREASLLTTRLQCSLRNPPLFSLRQTEGHLDFLQLLDEESGKVGELWTSVDTSYQRLERTVDGGTAQLLQGQMEEELKRWRDVLQELKAEQTKTEQTLSFWKEYQRLSEQCCLLLRNLRCQWEDLCRSSPEPAPRRNVHAIQKLQQAAEGLQSMMGDVRAASEPLIGRLEPVAANLIKLELQHLSWDVQLLGQATLRQKERLKFFSELSAAFAPPADVSHRSGRALLFSVGTGRAEPLCWQQAESMIHKSERNRKPQAELPPPQSFPEKCRHLNSVQQRLQEELNSLKSQQCAGLHNMLTVHQRLQAQVTLGQQRLQALLCQAVHSSEEATEEEKSELVAQAIARKRSWFTSVAEVVRLRPVLEDQLSRWGVYRSSRQLILDLLEDIDYVLPPAATDDYQRVLDALVGHSDAYSQTLEAGRQLCDTATDCELQTRLQTEVQDLEKAWDKTQSELEQRCELVHKGVQKWSRCQEAIASFMSEIEELEAALKRPGSGPGCQEEKRVQESELALQRLAGGLRELTAMRSDVAAEDSALLEQQLEQLHGQWEELCTKVSLRRQEIADRLSAWTIFNDKKKEFCDWLTQMENKASHRGYLSMEEMVEKLKKDCMEEINLFSENKSHLKQLGEQLLLASEAAKQTQVRGSLLEVNQRWHSLFHHIEARVKKLKETLATMQQLDKNMSNLRWWLSAKEAELSRPITYSVCDHQEIQRRLAEQQELQRDIQQHTEGVESVLGLCEALLRDEDAAGGGGELEGDSVRETSRSLEQRWRSICTLALDRRLRIEETWRLWCKFLDDYSRFEDWLKMAERTAASPNSADVLYTVAKEELKKFEGLQRQVQERLTHLELVNNQYRRLARENRTDRASQLKAMVHEGNRRWDALLRRVAAIVRRLKYFTGQREEFEGTRDSMLVWLTELDLQLTNVEHFSESDVHHKIQQLNSFRKEITLNTERIDGLIVFGEGLIQKSSPPDAALIEDQLEELHTFCQEVFSRLVRFHQRLSQPPLTAEEPELSSAGFSLDTSLELICRPQLGRSFGSLPATPTHLLASPLERSGRETPLSVDSLPLEWDHTGDVGGSSSHEEEEEEDEEEERAYFSALSASSTSVSLHDPPTWQPQTLDSEERVESSPTLTSTPNKQDSLGLTCERCSSSSSAEDPEETGLTGLTHPHQSGVIGCRELLQAQSDSQEQHRLESGLHDITSWLQSTVPALERMQQTERAGGMEDLRAEAKDLREMQEAFARHQPLVLRANRLPGGAPDLQARLGAVNRAWSRGRAFLHRWDTSLRKALANCQEFHESIHSLLLWLDHAERRRHAAGVSRPDASLGALQDRRRALQDLREELRQRQAQHTSLQLLWCQLQPEEAPEDSRETREKIAVTGSKLKLLLQQADDDLDALRQRLDRPPASDRRSCADASPQVTQSRKVSSTQRKGGPSPPRPLLYRLFRAALPLFLLLLLLLLLPCLIPVWVSNPGCAGTNNFARSFHPMLRYTNGPPPT